jgi:hypothetical protein
MQLLKRSVNYPEYVLARTAAGGLVICHDGGVDLGLEVVRDDGLDLEADFETHCDELAEEMRVLVAQAREEFGL